MAYRGLISLADVQAVLPSVSASVARMRIRHATDALEKAIGRKLGLRVYPEDEGEIIETFGRDWLYVSSYPIRSVEAVLFDGEVQDLEDIENQAQRYNDDGVLSIYAPRDTVVKAEYSGGYILPGDSELAYNRSGGVLQLQGGVSDTGDVTILGLTEDGTTTETVTLDGASWVSTNAEWLPGQVWEITSYDHTGTITAKLAGQTLGTLTSSQNILAQQDVPGDIQSLLLDMVVSGVTRPVKGIQREELPGGAKVQWATNTGSKSEIMSAFEAVVNRYIRFRTA